MRTGEKPEDFTTVPFPLGQGVFRLDQAFTDVADARFQQFNRSPQQFSQPQEVDANFIEVAIPYTELGGLQPGDEITIGAVVGTAGVYGNQYRQLDTTHLGNRLQSGKDPVFNLNVYQLEGLKVRLAIDPDPDSDGLLTARELDLGEVVMLGATERQGGGASKASILGDALEALVGAVYLDAGLAPVRSWVQRTFAELLSADTPPVARDAKSEFQERVMARFGIFPDYEVVHDNGIESDALRFTVAVKVQGERWAFATDRTKRGAEKQAASFALAHPGLADD